jgi:hypothetical protein
LQSGGTVLQHGPETVGSSKPPLVMTWADATAGTKLSAAAANR